MDKLFWIGFVGAVVAGLFAVLQAKKVMGYSEGTEKMQKLAASIREGANAYLKRQYTTVLKVFAIVFVVLLVIAFAPAAKCSPSLPRSRSSRAASGRCSPVSSA